MKGKIGYYSFQCEVLLHEFSKLKGKMTEDHAVQNITH